MNKHNKEYFVVTPAQRRDFDRCYRTISKARRFDYLREARDYLERVPLQPYLGIMMIKYAPDSGDIEYTKDIW